MSGLIADAKTLIDKARVETQVQIWCATIACYSVFILYKSNLLMCPRSESLVHLQRDNDGGKCDPGCVQPGAAVWGGGRRSWCHGQSLTSKTNTSHPTTTTSLFLLIFMLNLFSFFDLLCHAAECRVDHLELHFCSVELTRKAPSCK